MTTQSKSDFWQQHITTWQSSGISQAAYCDKNNLKLSSFSYWRGKQSKSRPKLVSVSMPVTAAFAELSLPGGIQLQLPISALEQTLPVLWRLLREQRVC